MSDLANFRMGPLPPPDPKVVEERLLNALRESFMHYKNGRKAKEGDIVVALTNKRIGVLHSTSANSDTCNGRLAVTSDNDPYVTIKECLHIEDVKLADVPDRST